VSGTVLRLTVDRIACDGRGLCAELMPEWIDLDDWGYPIIAEKPVSSVAADEARRAVAACPTMALRLSRGPAPKGSSEGAESSRRPTTVTTRTTPTRGRRQAGPAVSGVAIGSTSAVPVGQAARFSDPAGNGPAWLVHRVAGEFVAFSARCADAGCTVTFDFGAMEFYCRCSGSRYDARTGQVVAGPPRSPLRPIPVRVADGMIRVG
jgi:ferredoxin